MSVKDFAKNSLLIKNFLAINKNNNFLSTPDVKIIDRNCLENNLTTRQTTLIYNYFVCHNNKTKAIVNTYDCSYDVAGKSTHKYFTSKLNDIIRKIILETIDEKYKKDNVFINEIKEYIKKQIMFLVQTEDNDRLVKMLSLYIKINKLNIANDSTVEKIANITLNKLKDD